MFELFLVIEIIVLILNLISMDFIMIFMGACFVFAGISDVRKSTFTKDHFNWFLKISLPIYCVISIIMFLLTTIFVNVFLGIFILIILILCGLFYYWIIARICK